MSPGVTIILAVVGVFVVAPLGFRLLLTLFEPGIDDAAPTRSRIFSRRKKDSGDWGRADAGMLSSSRSKRLLPHQRGRGPGRMR